MAWDFATDPEFEAQLEWMRGFVRDEIIPLETLDIDEPTFDRITAPLKEQVKEQGLWAAHLPPELGGGGFGQVKLGPDARDPRPLPLRARRSSATTRPTPATPSCSPSAAPRSRRSGGCSRCCDGELRSCFSMTEPGAGADPTLLATRAVLDGDE